MSVVKWGTLSSPSIAGMAGAEPVAITNASAVMLALGATHLLPLAAGFKQSKFRPQGREGALEQLHGFCQVVEEAVTIGNKDLDRLILALQLMKRVTNKCRSNSKLPELVDLFLSRPLVTVPLAAKLIKVTPKAVDLMLEQLGGALPRELTGRRRYRTPPGTRPPPELPPVRSARCSKPPGRRERNTVTCESV